MATRTVKVHLVAAGDYHDIDFARLEVLKLLGENEKIRVSVAQNYRDLDAIDRADYLVTYTCNVVPSRRGAEGAARLRVGRQTLVCAARHELDPEVPGRRSRRQSGNRADVDEHARHAVHRASADPAVQGARGGSESRTGQRHRRIRNRRRTLSVAHPRQAAHAARYALQRRRKRIRRRTVERRCAAAGVLHPQSRQRRSVVPEPRSLPRPLRHAADDGRYPRIERGSWQLPQYYELLRRGIAYCARGAQ